MGAETRLVCRRCAQIKQACDGKLPCARCVRLSLPCHPRDATLDDVGQPDDVPKARIRRVQTGCVMCKRRKKKCDEVKPRCGDCRRLCLDCVWISDRNKEKKSLAVQKPHVTDLSNSNGVAHSTNANTSPNGNSNGVNGFSTQRHDNQYPANAVFPESLQTGFHVSTPVATQQSGLQAYGTEGLTSQMPIRASPGPGNSPQQSSNSNGSATANTPMSYRERGSQSYGSISSQTPSVPSYEASQPYCDPNAIFPLTSSFANSAVTAAILGTLGTSDWETEAEHDKTWDANGAYAAGWPDAATDFNTVPSHGSTDQADPATVSLTVYVMQLMPQLPDPQDKALLNHYATIVASVLSRRLSEASPYNTYLLPMAQGNKLVLHCILALSANHWREMIPYMWRRGLVHKSKATQALAGLLPHVDKMSGDVALVSSLLLCMTELFDGTSEGWKLHLKGARRLLTSFRNQHGKVMTGHYKFLLRLARFLDSAATISTCRPPLIGDDEEEARTLEGLCASPDEEDSAVYGIPKELFHLVDQVNGIAALRKTRVDAESERKFRDAALVVEKRIDSWSYEYGGLSQAVWTLTPHNNDVLYATMAFEHAVRLRLHQIVEGYDLNNPRVVTAVEGIVDAVQRIRYGSPVETCLLFPLVMAGGACWALEQRVVVQDRLLVMERTCGFGYIHNARDLVERVWAQRDQTAGTGTIVNWARIRFEEMNGLVVF